MRAVRTVSLSLACVVASLGFAPAPVYKANYRDPGFVLKQLQGTWAMPIYEHGGRTMISVGEAYTVKIVKDQWSFFISKNGGPLTNNKSSSYTLKLDPKANPAHIDFIQSKTYSLLGVYVLEADTLKIAFRITNDEKKDRSTDLANAGPNDYVLELRRQR